MEEKAVRYVLYDKRIKKYYKKLHYSCKWVESKGDATLYRTKSGITRVYGPGNKTFYYDVDGNQVNTNIFEGMTWKEKQEKLEKFKTVRRFADEFYEIHEIIIK